MPSAPVPKFGCPLCGWNHVVKRTGADAVNKGKPVKRYGEVFRFGRIPLAGFGVLRWYVSHGNCSEEKFALGQKRGFEVVGEVPIDGLVGDPDWDWVVDDVYRRAKEIVEMVDNAREAQNA